MDRSSSIEGVDSMERAGLSDDVIREIISTLVTLAIRAAIPELFGFARTTLIEIFDEYYSSVTKVFVDAGLEGGDLRNTMSSATCMKPPEFDGVKD